MSDRDTCAANGTLLEPTPADWQCQVHERWLAYPEWKAGGCFWCHPELIPNAQVRTVNGKPSAIGAARKKLYDQLRALTPSERRALERHDRRTDAAA